MSKLLSKYIASFDYFDKSSTALSATSGSISISSFVTVIGTSVGITSASLSLTFSLSTGLLQDFMTIINKERNYRELKESIRMMKGQEDKKIDIDQLIKYKTMLSYCLKCKRIHKAMIQ